MKPEFETSPIQFLMIFLRETPSGGIEEFQLQIMRNGILSTKGSSYQRPFNEFIGEETRIKVLVTGDIELNEKNVFLGLKMAFPEWDFQSYPLIIQKLFLKNSSWSAEEEVGVLATVREDQINEGNQWKSPCVLVLSPKDTRVPPESTKPEDLPSFLKLEASQEDVGEQGLTGDFFEVETSGKGTTPAEEIDFASILDDAEALAFGDKETDRKLTDNMRFSQLSIDREIADELIEADLERKEPYQGLFEDDQEETFKGFETKEPFDFSFLEGASTFSPTFDKEEFNESDLLEEKIDSRPFIDDEEDYISPQFREPQIEFEMEGIIDETENEVDIRSLTSNDFEVEQVPYATKKINEIVDKLRPIIADRIRVLPLRKIAMYSISIGLITVALSFAVKIYEEKILKPSLDSNRKSAGIVDPVDWSVDWILKNNLEMTEVEPDVLSNLWQESSEYHQYIIWLDNEWTPRISMFEKIRTGLRTIGSVILVPGLLIVLTTFFVRIMPFVKKVKIKPSDLDKTNKVSLSFTTYTNDWSLVDAWAKETGFKILEIEGSRRLYRRKASIAHPPILCVISKSNDQIQLEAWVSTRIPTFLIPILSDLGLEVLEDKNSFIPASIKGDLNKLLLKLGHPPMA